MNWQKVYDFVETVTDRLFSLIVASPYSAAIIIVCVAVIVYMVW